MRTVYMSLFVLMASPAMALPPLSENKTVTEGLIAVGLAIEISDRCAELAPRKVKGLRFLLSLKQAARDAGYSDAQIDAYIDDDVEKDRLEARARAVLAAKGASGDAPGPYCSVGRDEIASDSQVGQLLRD